MRKILLLLFINVFIFPVKDLKLSGRYKIEFDGTYGTYSDGYITFKDVEYKFEQYKFLPHNGQIEYSKNTVYLKSKFSSPLILGIRNEEISKDTIKFGIYNTNGKYDYLDIAIGKGKLIKMK